MTDAEKTFLELALAQQVSEWASREPIEGDKLHAAMLVVYSERANPELRGEYHRLLTEGREADKRSQECRGRIPEPIARQWYREWRDARETSK